MKHLSQRRLFVTLMTLFATTFSVAITGPVLGAQADLLTDIVKIALLIAVSTACISFVMWSLTHLNIDSIPRGALAGFLTAVTIIPLPAFLSNLKNHIMHAHQTSGDSLFGAVSSAIPQAIDAGLYTFVDITKASLVAITASMILGAAISVYVTPRKLD